MKRLIFIILGMCCLLAWGEDGFHIFTDTDGRAINARIVSFDARKQLIKVKLENGRQGDIPLAKLSDADKEYVEAWNKTRDFMNEQRFRFSAKRYKEDNEAKSSRGGALERTAENVGFEVQLENRSETPFEEIEIQYCIFYEQEIAQSGNRCDQGIFCGKLDVEKMQSRSEKSFRTEPVIIFKMELSDGYYYGSGANSSQRGDVHGIWLRASLSLPNGEKVVREYSLPDSLPNSYKWTAESVAAGLNK